MVADAVVVVVLPVVFERQLVAQRGGQRQQAGGAGPRGQRGLEARRVGRQRDGDGVAVGQVLRLQLLLLERTHRNSGCCHDGKEWSVEHPTTPTPPALIAT